jgi:hypothetical protein
MSVTSKTTSQVIAWGKNAENEKKLSRRINPRHLKTSPSKRKLEKVTSQRHIASIIQQAGLPYSESLYVIA